jgi:carbamoyl-phosphate synthase large subunit
MAMGIMLRTSSGEGSPKQHRVLITGAGTGASNNLIRSLRAADPNLAIIGCHYDRFVLMKSPADSNYFVPARDDLPYARDLNRVVATEQIDLIIPNSDEDVRRVSATRNELSCRHFLPADEVITLCQDKYALTEFLRARGIPAPRTYPVDDVASIDVPFQWLAAKGKIWCRMRTGNGSMGALPVVTVDQARSWVSYWQEMRGVPASSFTLSEYLPGRDFAVQGLWKEGNVVLLKICERLSYFGGKNQPSGSSSTPALGKLVVDPRVREICERAVRAVDAGASGVFSVDLKEDETGTPCITEINAGRFCMITNIFDLAGNNSMAGAYLQLAFDARVELTDEGDSDDYYLVRDLDTLPTIFQADSMFERIREVDE